MPVIPPRIALIIPCWRDADLAVKRALPLVGHTAVEQIILAGVDGCEPSVSLPASLLWASVSKPSRGAQMNAGAASARADIFLFHHVDSDLTGAHLDAIVARLREPNVIGGAFYRAFDERHPELRFLENFERWHSRAFGTIYGDQSVFIRSEVFKRIGGFAPIPLMEDVDFSRRLRRAGEIALLDPPLKSSPARQMEQGSWRVTWRNLLFLLAFRFGVSPVRLHVWYYEDSLMQLPPPAHRNPLEIVPSK